MHFIWKMSQTKYSFGVALCRMREQCEILMVKKRFTYHYFEFVYGKYRKRDDKNIIRLLDNMTYREKLAIANLDFSEMWSNIWLSSPENYSPARLHSRPPGGFTSDPKYHRKKAKFDAVFRRDGGKRIRRLIDASTNSEANWEIPKGHRATGELDMDTAIREFGEETELSEGVNMLWCAKPIVTSHRSRGTIYKTVYFLAEYTGKNTPDVRFRSPLQYTEVECIKWVSLPEIRFLRLNPTTHRRVCRLFKKISSAFRTERAKAQTSRLMYA